MSGRANDPTEWANRRKAAVERAKQIREDRKNALSDGDTFQPQVNPRSNPPPVKQSDSLDKLASQVSRTNDPMEMPLPGSRNQGYNPQSDLPPSPNSDTLGKELKRHNNVPSGNQAARDAQYKSQFLQQYEDQKRRQREEREPVARRPAQDERAAPPEPEDDPFFNMLRSDGNNGRSSGPGWNSDTSTSGLGAAPQRRALGARQRSDGDKPPARPSAFRSHSDGAATISPRGDAMGNENSSNGIRVSPRTNELAIAKPRLSLLKNKIRQSESAGSRSFNGKQSLGLMEQDSSENIAQGRRTAPDNGSNPSDGSYQFNPARERRGVAQQSEWDNSDVTSNNHNSRGPTNRRNQNNYAAESDDYERPPVNSKMNNAQQRREDARKPPANNASRNPPAEAPAPYRSPNPIEDVPVPAVAKSFGYVEPSPYPDEEEEAPMEGEQLQCPDCGRKFNPVPYQKHIKICQKVFLKKRKVFDSKKMRIADDPELLKLNAQAQREEMKAKKAAAKAAPKAAPAEENFFPAAKSKSANTQNQPIQAGEALPKWKAQSTAFREAMKAMRNYQKAVESGAPLPPPVASAPDPSLIPCPHCGRRFNEKAAERHIPKCVDIKAKPSSLKKGAGVGIGSAVAGGKKGGR